MADQRIEHEELTIWSDTPIAAVRGEDGIGQRCWSRGEGDWRARYRATVAIDRPVIDIATLPAAEVRSLPGEIVQYLLPSRYCQSDRLEGFVRREFGGLSGGALATALTDWVGAAID